jgi:hypothetical protein
MGNLTNKEFEVLKKQYVDYHLKDITSDMFRALDDPTFSVALIYDKLELLKPQLNAKEYMDILMKLHKLRHGEKIKLEVEGNLHIKGYETVSPDMFPDNVIIDVHDKVE